MSIKQAALSDLSLVKRITETTISEIYPHYYPQGAVEFFLSHHSESAIAEDMIMRRNLFPANTEKLCWLLRCPPKDYIKSGVIKTRNFILSP